MPRDVVNAWRFDEINYLWVHSYDQGRPTIHGSAPHCHHTRGKELNNYKDMERFKTYVVEGEKYPKGDPESRILKA